MDRYTNWLKLLFTKNTQKTPMNCGGNSNITSHAEGEGGRQQCDMGEMASICLLCQPSQNLNYLQLFTMLNNLSSCPWST